MPVEDVIILVAASILTTMRTSDVSTIASSDKLFNVHAPNAAVSSNTEETPSLLAPVIERYRTFHLFPKLSPELRIKIWTAARPEARVVKIDKVVIGAVVKDDHDPLFAKSSAKVPSLLHVNYEARQVALHWYKLSTTRMPSSECPSIPRFYFDLSRDWAYIHCKECNGKGCPDEERVLEANCGLSPIYNYPWVSDIKRVVYQFDLENPAPHGYLPRIKMADFWINFRHVREVMVVDAAKCMTSRSQAPVAMFKRIGIPFYELSLYTAWDIYQNYIRDMEKDAVTDGLALSLVEKISFVEFNDGRRLAEIYGT